MQPMPPSTEELRAFGMGLCTPERAAQIEAFLLRHSDCSEALRTPDVVERLALLGYNEPVGGTPADLTQLIRKGNDRWRELIESLGMTKSK